MNTSQVQSSSITPVISDTSTSQTVPVSLFSTDLTAQEKLQQATPQPASKYPPLHVNCACNQCTFEFPNLHELEQVSAIEYYSHNCIRDKALFGGETSVTTQPRPPSTDGAQNNDLILLQGLSIRVGFDF